MVRISQGLSAATEGILSSQASAKDDDKTTKSLIHKTKSLIDISSNISTPTGRTFDVAPLVPVALSAPACLSRGTSQDGGEGGRGVEASSSVCAGAYLPVCPPQPNAHHASAENASKCTGREANPAHVQSAGGGFTVGEHTNWVCGGMDGVGGVGGVTRSRARSRLAPLLPIEPASTPLALHQVCIGLSLPASPSTSCGASSATPTGARFSLRAAFPVFSAAASNGFVTGGSLATVVASSIAAVETHGAAGGVVGEGKGADGEVMERVPGCYHAHTHTPLNTDYCSTQKAVAWSDSSEESGGKGDRSASWGGIGGGSARIVGALRANLSSASKMASSMHRRTKSSPVMLKRLVLPWEGVRSGSGDGLLVRSESESFSLLQHAQEQSFPLSLEDVLQAVTQERTVLPNCQDQDSGEWPHDWFELAQHKHLALKHAALPSAPAPTPHSNASERTIAKMENGRIAVQLETCASEPLPTSASQSLPLGPDNEVVQGGASVGHLQPLATHLQTGNRGHGGYGERENEGESVIVQSSAPSTNGAGHHKRSYTYSDGCNPFAPNLF